MERLCVTSVDSAKSTRCRRKERRRQVGLADRFFELKPSSAELGYHSPLSIATI